MKNYILSFILLATTTVVADALKNTLMNFKSERAATNVIRMDGLKVRRNKKTVSKPKSRPANTVIGYYKKGKPVHKKEADAYIKKVTKGKIKDIDRLPRKQRLLVLKDLQSIYKEKHFVSRSKKSVVATIDGYKVRKREADKYLVKVSSGQVKDFDRLDSAKRKLLIKDLARKIVILAAAKREIKKEHQREIFKQIWLDRKRKETKVTPDELLALYNKKTEKVLSMNPQANIPSYISLGMTLKKEVIEEKIMMKIMKDAKIKILDENLSNEIIDSNTTIKG